MNCTCRKVTPSFSVVVTPASLLLSSSSLLKSLTETGAHWLATLAGQPALGTHPLTSFFLHYSTWTLLLLIICTDVRVPRACSAFGSQRMALDSLGLELQMIVRSLRMEPESYGRAASTLNCCLALRPVPGLLQGSEARP